MNPIFYLSILLLSLSLSFSAPRTAADWKVIQSSDTLDLYLKEQLTGTLVQSIAVNDGSRTIVIERRTKVGGGSDAAASMDLIERRSYDFDGNLVAAFQELAGDAGVSTWELKRGNGKGWTLAVTAGGSERTQSAARVTENLDMTYALYKGIKSRSLRAGVALNDTVFDLTSGAAITMSAKCSAAPGAANGFSWDFTTITGETGRAERWTLDTNGTTLYEEIFPFVARKKRTGNGRRDEKMASAFSLVEALSIPAPRAARDGERIALALDSALAPDSSVLPLYRRSGNSWVLERGAQACPESGGPSEQGLRKFTIATTTMQCDDAGIRRLADSLTRGRKDRCDSIAACNNHVFARLEKRYSPTFSNALETLSAGYGDCGEHAVLLGALLRAAGIPARVALGLVYVTDRKGYYYHAWVMAESHGSWVFADPAFGSFPAARDRVPLVIDDGGTDIVKIARLIGRIKIEYVKAQ